MRSMRRSHPTHGRYKSANDGSRSLTKRQEELLRWLLLAGIPMFIGILIFQGRPLPSRLAWMFVAQAAGFALLLLLRATLGPPKG